MHLYVGDTPTATNLDAFNFTAEERSIHHMWQMDKVCRSLSVAKSPSTHRPFFLLPRGSHWAVWMHTVNTASPDTAIVTGNVSSSCTRATDPVFFLCCSSEQLEQVDRVAAITEAEDPDYTAMLVCGCCAQRSRTRRAQVLRTTWNLTLLTFGRCPATVIHTVSGEEGCLGPSDARQVGHCVGAACHAPVGCV